MKHYTKEEWEREQYKGQWEANPYTLDRVAQGEIPADFIGKRTVMVRGPVGVQLLTEGYHFTIEGGCEPRSIIDMQRQLYPKGSRIILKQLKDPYRKMEPGSRCRLNHIDDVGTFHVDWDDGSTLGLIPGEDSFMVRSPNTP